MDIPWKSESPFHVIYLCLLDLFRLSPTLFIFFNQLLLYSCTYVLVDLIKIQLMIDSASVPSGE